MSRLFDAVFKAGGEAAQVLYPAATDGTECYKSPAGVSVNETLTASIRSNGTEASYRLAELDEFIHERVEIQPETRITFYTEPRSVGADRIRYIRMHLRKLRESRSLKTLLITSPIADDGKSTIALNLATALAEEGKHRVLLLEADLHHASLVPQLGLAKPSAGLMDCLEGGVDPLSLLRRLDPLGWYLLPAGQTHSNPTDLLQTSSYASVIESLTNHFDWILVDSPPVIALTDAVFLRQHADATLLVVRAGHTPQEAVEEAVRQVGREHIVGMVLNGVEGLDRLYSKYGGGYYEAGESGKSRV